VLSLAYAQRCRFLIMEQCCGHLAIEMFPRKQEITAISAPILQRDRELSLAHAHRCIFLIMEQCFGPLAVEIIPGNTAISAPVLPTELELSLAHAQRCSFLILEQCCGPLAVGIFPGKHCVFSYYLANRARAKSGACAEVQFPDYGTVLSYSDSRNNSRKALRLQHLICQESESSVLRMRRCAVSLLWNSVVVPWQ
jgi:hypothetical protein